MMGADYYDEPGSEPPAGGIPLGIGHNCQIEGAIIDKNVRMGEGVVIKPFPRGTEIDERRLGGSGWHRGDPQEHGPAPRHVYWAG